MPVEEPLDPWLLLALGAFVVVPVVLGMRAIAARGRSRRRLNARAGSPVERGLGALSGNQGDQLWSSWVEGWLFRAGIRSAGATGRFLFLEAVAVAVGGAAALLVHQAGAFAEALGWLAEIPGGVGDFLAPALHAGPGTLFLLAASAPILVVRARRRTLVEEVEKDLPMALALLATLVQSGLGFDAAVERMMRALDPERALSVEFALLRSELQAGVDRVRCFRRLSRRLEVPSVHIFVSAMVHSEQVGGGIAESLRRQANEVWNRRREAAIAKAQVMPTRLAIPLTICFLPGIFVYTFGPALAEFLDIAEGVVPSLR